MTKNRLSEVFLDDPLGLLDVAPTVVKVDRTPVEQKLIESFIEINEFFEENNREPSLTGSIDELMLASRLQAMRTAPEKVKVLSPFDFYNLLRCEQSKSITVEDILGEDPLSLLTLDEPDNSIFSLKYVKKSDRLRPDYISRRNICQDFADYEAMFDAVHNDLKCGTRKLTVFKEHDMAEGKFFVLRGMLLYLEQSNATEQEMPYESGTRIRNDGRTRCIFDNGTESDMLLRSLYKALLKDGFGVSEKIEIDNPEAEILDQDIQNGFIYVLSSLSSNPQIRAKKDLYKIGCCRGDVTERIKNAINEPTYLMSDVKVELTVRCYNLNIRALEGTIHHFFEKVNVNFEVFDREGNKHYPREWFIAPLTVIQEAIQLIVNGEIEKYKYDDKTQMLVML
jgi:hypothetical protein